MSLRRTGHLLAALLVVACAPQGDGVLVLAGPTLIDGSGGPPIRDALIVIRDGRIDAVARVNEIPVPRGAEVVSLVGKTVIPGLIDAHAHVERWAGSRYIAWGVTAVRDMNGGPDSAYVVRNEFNLGSVLGPRLYTSGPMIDGVPPTYPHATGVATPDEARRAAGRRALAGADHLKAYTKLTPVLMRALMDEAATLQRPVAAHLGKTDALTAARAGVASLEHAAGVVQAAAPNAAAVIRAHDLFFAGWTVEERSWADLDSATVARVARQLAETRVAVVPTLVLHDVLSRLDDAALLRRRAMADVPADARSVRDVAGLLRRSGWSAPDFAAFRRSQPRLRQFVREFKRAGGLVAAGSDAVNQLLVPGAALHDELEQLVAAGFTPLEAITAATRHAATLMGVDSLGMLAPGKVADLVVLNRDPSDDIRATRAIAWVLLRGRRIATDSLRATWTR